MSSTEAAPQKTILIFGATGKVGRKVVEAALGTWKVVLYVRNPSKVPEGLHSQLTIVKGDLTDKDGIDNVVRTYQPHALVDASSVLNVPFQNTNNNAHRGLIYTTVEEALVKDGRLNDCFVICVGGQVKTECTTNKHRLIDDRLLVCIRTWHACLLWSSSPQTLSLPLTHTYHLLSTIHHHLHTTGAA